MKDEHYIIYYEWHNNPTQWEEDELEMGWHKANTVHEGPISHWLRDKLIEKEKTYVLVNAMPINSFNYVFLKGSFL